MANTPVIMLGVGLFVFALLNVFLLMENTRKGTEILSMKAAQRSLSSQLHEVRKKRSIESGDHSVKKIIREEINRPLLEKIIKLLPQAIKSQPKVCLCDCQGCLHFAPNDTSFNYTETKTVRQGPPGPVGPRGPMGPKGERGLGLISPQLRVADINKTAREGENKTFTCKFFGNPIPTVEWNTNVNDTSKIVHSSKVLLKTSEIVSSVQLSKIGWPDRGVVKCKAKSLIGEDETRGMLNVKIKPIIHLSTKLINTFLTSDLTFPQCRVEAYPNVTSIKWSKGYGEFPSTRSTETNGVLTIRNVKNTDEGFYICTVENAMGKSQSIVQLNVRSFAIISSPSEIVSTYTLPIELTCAAQGKTVSGYWKTLDTGKILPLVKDTYGDKMNYWERLTKNWDKTYEKEIRNITVKIEKEGAYMCEFSDGEVEGRNAIQVLHLNFKSEIITSEEQKKKIYGWIQNFTTPSQMKLCLESDNSGYDSSSDVINYYKKSCGSERSVLTLVKSGSWIVGTFTTKKTDKFGTDRGFVFVKEKNDLRILETPSKVCTFSSYIMCFDDRTLRVKLEDEYKNRYNGYRYYWNIKQDIDGSIGKKIDQLEVFYM